MNDIQLYQRCSELIDKKICDGLSDDETFELAELKRQLADLEANNRITEAKAKLVKEKRMRRVNKQFKQDEDWGNAQLGLERQGHMRRGLSCPDGVNDMFSVEYTRTKKPLAYIRDKMSEAVGHVTQARVPVVVIFQGDYDRHDAMVIMRFRDFRDLHGNEGRRVEINKSSESGWSNPYKERLIELGQKISKDDEFLPPPPANKFSSYRDDDYNDLRDLQHLMDLMRTYEAGASAMLGKLTPLLTNLGPTNG